MTSNGTPPRTNSDDPLEAIRENREAVEQLALEYRSDDLDSAARIALALADGERPDHNDLKAWGIGASGDFGMVTGPPTDLAASSEALDAIEQVLQEIHPEL